MPPLIQLDGLKPCSSELSRYVQMHVVAAPNFRSLLTAALLRSRAATAADCRILLCIVAVPL